MSLLGLKLAAAALILAAGWLGGWAPLAGRARLAESPWLSCGNAFSAGIFLGIGLIHMLATADRSWQSLGFEYPIAYVLAAAAFAAVLLIEHVLLPDPAHAMTHAHAGEGLPRIRPAAESTPWYVYGLLVGLSLHSVLAGIALGLEPQAARIHAILIAILAHKATEGLALGMSLARSDEGDRSRSDARRLVTVFAWATPVGILVGVLARSLLASPASQTFDAVVSALAAGVFLYIASMDMLQDELLKPGNRWAKWASAALGLAATAALAGL